MSEHGKVIDLSHCPCEIHQKPIGECGCPVALIDPDWLERDLNESFRRLGEQMAREQDERIMAVLMGEEACQKPQHSLTIPTEANDAD